MRKFGYWNLAIGYWNVIKQFTTLDFYTLSVWKDSEQFVSSLVIRRGRSSTERMKRALFGTVGSVKPCDSTRFPQVVYSYISTSIITLNTSVVRRLFRTFPPTYYNYYEINK